MNAITSTAARRIPDLARLLALGAALSCGLVAAPPAPHDPLKTDAPIADNVARCVRLLSDEAMRSRADGPMARSAPDFAQSLAAGPPALAIIEKITRRISSDDFTDAYVRWQLTSFELPEFAMTDRAFDRLVETLPACIENPRAQPALIEALQRASAIGALSERQQAEVNQRLNGLAALSSRAQAFNVPALEFRAWLEKRFEAQPHRRLALVLERAAALAGAGWPIEEIKSEIDEALTKAARQREFTLEQRQALIRGAMQRITKPRLHLAGAGLAENALAANYGTTGVFDFDVQRWERLLRAP